MRGSDRVQGERTVAESGYWVGWLLQTHLDVTFEVLQPSFPLVVLGPLGSVYRDLSPMSQWTALNLFFREILDPILVLLFQPSAFLPIIVIGVRDCPNDGEEDGPISRGKFGFPSEERGGKSCMFERFEGGWRGSCWDGFGGRCRGDRHGWCYRCWWSDLGHDCRGVAG